MSTRGERGAQAMDPTRKVPLVGCSACLAMRPSRPALDDEEMYRDIAKAIEAVNLPMIVYHAKSLAWTLGLVGVLNRDLPEGVRAVALDPGSGVDTDMLKACLPDAHDQFIGPESWAGYAADYLVELYNTDAAGSLTVPHPGTSGS